MKPRHPLKSIALQAGLSLATVDRVLHGRAGVSQTARNRVTGALAELDRQGAQLRSSGRTFTLDLIMEAPRRFSTAVRAAFEAELPAMRPAAFRCRFHLAEEMEPADFAALLDRIRKRGSDGVILKAPDHRGVADRVNRLVDAGIPLVTLVTDLPRTRRLAHIGMDDRAAGATAAHLAMTALGDRAGVVLALISRAGFRGELDRCAGFEAALIDRGARLRLVTSGGTGGRDAAAAEQVERALAEHDDLLGLYSTGGGNIAANAVLARLPGRRPLHIVHDLDADNLSLLAAGKVQFAIHHDLRRDARSACQVILRHHRLLPRDLAIAPSTISIATPFNLPPPDR